MLDSKIPFEFDVDKSTDNPEIIINLRVEDAEKYQIVYASQLYDTFFCVFAKLEIENEALKSIKLSLVNYKGQINLGMLPGTKGTWGHSKEGFEFSLHLKGNAGKHAYNDESEVVVDCKNTPIAALKAEGLVIRRRLHPMHDVSTSLKKQLSKGVFDTEFFQRDGAFVTNKYHLDEIYKKFKNKNIANPHMALRVEGVCHTAYVTIV
jgi:hypothetical protein